MPALVVDGVLGEDMAEAVYRYRIHCNDEDSDFETPSGVWYETAPTTCPNCNSSNIDTNETTIIETMTQNDVNIASSDVDLSTHDVAFPDRSGYNVHYHGCYGVAEKGTTTTFDVSFDENLKLQGLMFKVDDNVNEGSNHWDPVADGDNTGTGTIERGSEDVCTLHDRTYLFTVANKNGSEFDLDWESDDLTSGTLSISSSNDTNVLVEEGLKLTFTGLSDFVDGDQFDLIIDHGDYMTVQMVDVDGIVFPAGTVLATFAQNWPCWSNEEFECLCPDVKDLFSWVYLRLIYRSTYGAENVKVKFVPLTRTVPA